MTTYEYAIANTWDATSLTNIQSLITHAPTTKPDQSVPLGSVRRQTLDHLVHTHGKRRFRWRWAAMSWADFETLVTFIWGDFDTENAEVSIVTPSRARAYSQYNAIAIMPVEGQDYQVDTAADGTDALRDLVITFEIESGPSEFSSDFSYEFTV